MEILDILQKYTLPVYENILIEYQKFLAHVVKPETEPDLVILWSWSRIVLRLWLGFFRSAFICSKLFIEVHPNLKQFIISQVQINDDLNSIKYSLATEI
jgi:hypothetical protein